ncbi:RICIN domain-containing protein [Runella sp. MFBS21]|uniref:RICIN domain-containing protein n=1 Tax=Runella sp. MFBS21 TaxID=3034018 RepID=UPI0023F9FA1C|nr:RICIN domain-containing protein [Runella sp. MFBS21]MDF7820199.1 RICIN domain-containing protein [Runella sp. MFBS21]
MKKIVSTNYYKNSLQNFSFLLLFGLSLFSSLEVTAQKDKDTYQKQVDEYLNNFDLSGIKNNLLLNKSAFTTDELEYFRKPVRNRKGQIVANINAREWQSLYERLSMADLRKGNDKIPDVGTLIEQDADKRSNNNVIPIGILNLDATFLDEKQAEENSKEKQQGKKAKSEQYEKVFFLAAAVLQKDIYQADVSFKIDPNLHISNNKNEIKRLEIDFQDGKGYQSFEMKAKAIPYRFTSTGERIITLRIYTQRGTYVFHSRIDVKQLERPKIYREFTVTAETVRQDTISVNSRLKNGRQAVSVPGANTRIILGCDQVFNKPIIIAEGFDFVNENSLNGLQAQSIATFQPYMNQGYDLVLVDYHNARDFIENNAEVLKNVILQVNNEKVGNEQLIVVGQSMSGLVGRWALRKMENDGIAHNVKLFIPFDTPHQGANVPVSITQMYWAANPSFLTNVFLRIFSTFGNYYSAIQTPAATQMLLHWGRPNLYGTGNRHPEFDSFRTRLQAMGNGGYPQNCRNIAMINGSLDASDRELFTRYGYGSNLISSRLFVPGPLPQLAYIEAYTNQINNNSRILNFWANGVFLWGGALVNYGSAFNNDFLPGGRSSFAIPRRVPTFYSGTFFDFCFIPTFSSIDYQGSRNTQNEREFLNVNNARNAGQTPFAAVYGFNNNSEHITRFLPWQALGIAENLLNNPGCPEVQPPPAPYFSQGSVPCLADPTTDPASVIVNLNMLSPTQGQYTHSWSVQPTGQTFTGSGDNFNFSVSEPGQYTVTCTRSFPNRPDLNSTTSIVVTVNYCNTGTGGNGPNGTCGYLEGDFAYVLDNGQSLYARYHNGTLYAVAVVGDTYQFVSRSTLVANGMFENFAGCFAETDPRENGNNLPFQNGCYTLKSKLSNKMMQMDNDGNGARIRQYPDNGQNNQIFKLESVDGDAYKVMAATSNRTLESPNGGTSYGTELQLWDYNGANYQKWQFVNMNDGSYRLNPKHTNQLVVDVSQNNTDNGNLLHLWGIHNGDNQRFIFQPVGCPSSGCTPPGAPSLSANPNTINSGQSTTLSASNCSGTVNWSTGATGTSISVSPTQTTIYTATCSANGCTSSNGSVTVTVNGGGSGGSGCALNKVRLVFRNDCCLHRLNGAKIQGSNDGSNWNDLYTINVNADGGWQEFTFGNTTSYSSVRFQAGPEGYGELRELEFYNNNTKLSGTAFATGGSWDESLYGYQYAFDGNTSGNMWHAANSGSAATIGLNNISGCGGGCTPPGAPSLSANPSTINSGQSTTLSASNCSGTVNWSTGATGVSISVSPTQTTTYTATCSANGCTSSNGSVTVNVNGGGGGCGSGTGLTANYFSGHELQGSPIATLTQSTIDMSGDESQNLPILNIQAANISARWEGQVEAPVSGSYTFNIRTDDGVRMWFNNNQVVDDWGYYGATDHNFTVTLNAGQKYDIKIEWKQGGGGYEAKFFWTYPGQSTQIVPACRLYPSSGGCTPPGAPSLSANPSTINSGQSTTLSASNCSGTVNWSTGASGTSISVSPSQTTTYTATCSVNGCTSSNGSVTVTVNGSSGSGCIVNKVIILFRNDCCLHRLNGAKIQGSNDGSNWTDLYTITVNGTGGWQEFTFGNTNSYQRVRFQSGSEGYGELRELEFYNGSTKLSGTAFGSDFSGNALDGDVNSLWHGTTNGTHNHAGLILNSCGGGRMGVVGEKEALLVNVEESIQLHPNPSTGQVTVRYYLAKGHQASLDFVNVAGMVVAAKNFIGEGGWQEDKTDLSKVPSGTYTLRWQSEGKQVTKKLLIVK